MTTTEDHGGAGRMPALPGEGRDQGQGVEELDTDRGHRLRRPDGRRHLLRGPCPEPAAPQQTIAVHVTDNGNDMVILVAREADDD